MMMYTCTEMEIVYMAVICNVDNQNTKIKAIKLQ